MLINKEQLANVKAKLQQAEATVQRLRTCEIENEVLLLEQ